MLFMSFHVFASVHCSLVITCWELAELLVPVCGDCILPLSDMVSWVRCGT